MRTSAVFGVRWTARRGCWSVWIRDVLTEPPAPGTVAMQAIQAIQAIRRSARPLPGMEEPEFSGETGHDSGVDN